MVNVVLFEPEIPPNTGNIARLVVGVNGHLYLVGKLGFSLSNKELKRAGLDYWQHLNIKTYKKLEDFQQSNPGRYVFFSKNAAVSLWDFDFKKGDYLFFGAETRGLPRELIDNNLERSVFIPQFGPVRSINLSNAVAIAVYEYIRQLGSTLSLPPLSNDC